MPVEAAGSADDETSPLDLLYQHALDSALIDDIAALTKQLEEQDASDVKEPPLEDYDAEQDHDSEEDVGPAAKVAK